MVTEGENTTPSSSDATAALSQNRPIMPESFAALDSEEWESRLAHFEDSLSGIHSVACGPYAGSSSTPVAEYSGDRACELRRSQSSSSVKICPTRTNRTSQGQVSSAASRKRRVALGSVEFFTEVGQKSLPRGSRRATG